MTDQDKIDQLTRALMKAASEAYHAEIVQAGLVADPNAFVEQRIQEWMGEETEKLPTCKVGTRVRVILHGQPREGRVVGETQDGRCYVVEFPGAQGPYRADVDKLECVIK